VKVCSNVIREKPILDIKSVIYGLIFSFYKPNSDDPLIHEAGELFCKNVKEFERLVNRTLNGEMTDGIPFG
jgi:ubiquitin-conjugating enzyme E2 M